MYFYYTHTLQFINRKLAEISDFKGNNKITELQTILQRESQN